jgi:hypothetical protein
MTKQVFRPSVNWSTLRFNSNERDDDAGEILAVLFERVKLRKAHGGGCLSGALENRFVWDFATGVYTYVAYEPGLLLMNQSREWVGQFLGSGST